MNKKTPKSERQMKNLKRYLKRIADDLGWKTVSGMFAQVHRQHFKDNPYSSDVFFNPNRKP